MQSRFFALVLAFQQKSFSNEGTRAIERKSDLVKGLRLTAKQDLFNMRKNAGSISCFFHLRYIFYAIIIMTLRGHGPKVIRYRCEVVRQQ